MTICENAHPEPSDPEQSETNRAAYDKKRLPKATNRTRTLSLVAEPNVVAVETCVRFTESAIFFLVRECSGVLLRFWRFQVVNSLLECCFLVHNDQY